MLDRRRTFEPGGISDFPERGSEALFVDMRANGVQHFALAVGQGGLVRLLLGGRREWCSRQGSFRYVTSITCCSCEIKHLFEF